MDPIRLINKFCSFYMAAGVDIISGYHLSIDVCHGNQPNKNKLEMYIKPLICLKQDRALQL